MSFRSNSSLVPIMYEYWSDGNREAGITRNDGGREGGEEEAGGGAGTGLLSFVVAGLDKT